MFLAALSTTVYGLGLAATLVVREVAMPAMDTLQEFNICSLAFTVYSESGQPHDGCHSSKDILNRVYKVLKSSS